MNVIGKATLNWKKYTEYVQRETINVKEHPEDTRCERTSCTACI